MQANTPRQERQMSQVDWSRAPEGAQAYMKENSEWFAGWWKRQGTQSYFCESLTGKWQASGGKPWGHPNMILRPATPQWRGPQDGLPPVGLNLQWHSEVYSWIGGKVVGHDQNTTIVRHNDGYAGCHLHELRMPETPEQKAAREREEYIQKIQKVLDDSFNTGERAAFRLYEAGLRFTTEDK